MEEVPLQRRLLRRREPLCSQPVNDKHDNVPRPLRGMGGQVISDTESREVGHGDPSQSRAEASRGVDATSGPTL